MKRIIAIIMMVSIVAAVFAGCGMPNIKDAVGAVTKSSGTTDASKPNDTGSTTKSGDNTSSPAQAVPGSELSTFMSNYIDAKSKLWDAMTKKFEEDQNNAFVMGGLAFAFVDLMVVEIGLFDTLTVKDGNMFKGKMMLSGIDAWKKVNGDIIEFGYDYTYPEDKNNSQKGDREVTTGKFDKKAQSLTYEHYTERNGSRIVRYIIEINKNGDSSYSSQVMSVGSSSGNEDKKLTGYFTWFQGQDIMSVIGEKADSDINFSFNSIYGKKDVKPEEMANGMDITSKVSFIGGKASYEDLSKK